MANLRDDDFNAFYSSLGRQSHISMKPLGVSNCISSFDRKAGFYGSLPKSSPQGVRKSLFEAKNKENEESTLGKDFSSNREFTGKTPIIVPQKKSGSNSDEAQDGRSIKPRRSMLGRRSTRNLLSTFAKDDSTFTIPKPLHSSSPFNSDRTNNYNPESTQQPRLQKTTSTPTLNHPFDAQDADASSFFNKGLSDSTWSVFKPSKKNDDSSKNYPAETPLSRGVSIAGPSRLVGGDKNLMVKNETNWKGKQSSAFTKDIKNNVPNIKPSAVVPTADQKMKLELLALKFQHNESLLNNSLKYKTSSENNSDDLKNDQESDSEKSHCIENNFSMKTKSAASNIILSARTRGQLRRAKQELSQAISPIIKEEEQRDFDDSHEQSTDSFVKHETLYSSQDCTLSEATIIGATQEPMHDTVKEENKVDVESANCDFAGESTSTHEGTSPSQDFGIILHCFEELKKEKEEMDYKLAAFVQQKESYDQKWNELSNVLNQFFCNTDKNSMLMSNIKFPRSIKKKVICTKARRSLIMSPRSCQNLPKSSILGNSKNYSDLKASFTCLKTPVQSKKLRSLRKSTCYTPNTLSSVVGDQFKDIFGEM